MIDDGIFLNQKKKEKKKEIKFRKAYQPTQLAHRFPIWWAAHLQ